MTVAEPVATKRTCPRCGFGGGESDYYKGARICKHCARFKAQEWQEENPERVQLHRRIERWRRYGMSPQQGVAMLDAQDWKCAICRESLRGGRFSEGDKAHVDHNHRTDQVRGLLCGLCNTMIGQSNDDPDLLRGAAAYLERTEP